MENTRKIILLENTLFKMSLKKNEFFKLNNIMHKTK